MAARRSIPGLPSIEASWPHGWGTGGVLAPGRCARRRWTWYGLTSLGPVSSARPCAPVFGATSAWSQARCGTPAIPRKVHVAQLEKPFEDYWVHSVPAKVRSNIRRAQRHLEHAGITITAGNTPELVRNFYDTYMKWIDWRARQRKIPLALARRQGRGRSRSRSSRPWLTSSAATATFRSRGRMPGRWARRFPCTPSAARLAGGCTPTGALPARYRLTEILIAQSLRHACEAGCQYLEMGESGNKESLASIKSRFGGQAFPLAEHYYERIPLSPA